MYCCAGDEAVARGAVFWLRLPYGLGTVEAGTGWEGWYPIVGGILDDVRVADAGALALVWGAAFFVVASRTRLRESSAAG